MSARPLLFGFVCVYPWLMDWLLALSRLGHVTTAVAAVRLTAALLAGACVGIERELRHQPAGLRTHIIISLGSCLLMLLSIWLPDSLGLSGADPARIAAQVVSGIGFLGAGAILRFGVDVKGLTTAASIWTCSAIGMALGAGFYLPAALCLVFVLIALSVLDRVERHFFIHQPHLKALSLSFDHCNIDSVEAEAILTRHKVRIRSYNVSMELEKDRMRLRYVVELPTGFDLRRLLKELKPLGKLTAIDIDEKI
jgi:putative Mg2+ transporter-C (MgtC) family protein